MPASERLVYSKDLARAGRIVRRLEAGGVWINMSEKPNPGGYFSGVKDSGFGAEMGNTPRAFILPRAEAVVLDSFSLQRILRLLNLWNCF
jgi:acyl-CoA reductase-like NAD-dependent aldehyde dehydrogenase